MQDWFKVDTKGLGKLLHRKGKIFVLHELVQNGWDTGATRVDVTFVREPGSRVATLRVEDDDPRGFEALAHAWTLFAESGKKADATRRGRFNLGEKLVLAACEEARIVTTTGGVAFDADGRRRLHERREVGSLFEGRLRIGAREFDEVCEAALLLLPPIGVETTFNGVRLEPRVPIAVFKAELRTEVADVEGHLRSTTRKAEVQVHEVRAGGEVGMLYELGIPVVETGDAFHVDVQQKVPLGLERDSVPPAYLRNLRGLVLNAVHHRLGAGQATSTWVREALGTRHVSENAVRTVVSSLFGPKAVVFDPSDREANKLAVSQGYVVVTGSQLSRDEWANVRRAGALLPAGQVTPSPKILSNPGGRPLATVAPEAYSPGEAATVELCERVAAKLLGRRVEVQVVQEPQQFWAACYGPCSPLSLNRSKLGRGFFEDGSVQPVLDLVLHELGHEYESDHLSRNYYDALTRLGAKLAVEAALNPSLIDWRRAA